MEINYDKIKLLNALKGQTKSNGGLNIQDLKSICKKIDNNYCFSNVKRKHIEEYISTHVDKLIFKPRLIDNCEERNRELEQFVKELKERNQELEKKLNDKEYIIKIQQSYSQVSSANVENKNIDDHYKPIKILQNIGDSFFEKTKKEHWYCSYFENINKLKNDLSGKVGELFIKELCDKIGIQTIYNGDIIFKDGTYDIIINNKKVEIKTARIGKDGSFQHENLKNYGYDYLLFVDILPNYFYLTFLEKFDLNTKHQNIKRKPHLRKDTTGIFKFDFSEKIIENCIKLGNSIKIDENTNIEDIKIFFDKLSC